MADWICFLGLVLFGCGGQSDQAKFNPGLVQQHADSTASSIERSAPPPRARAFGVRAFSRLFTNCFAHLHGIHPLRVSFFAFPIPAHVPVYTAGCSHIAQSLVVAMEKIDSLMTGDEGDPPSRATPAAARRPPPTARRPSPAIVRCPAAPATASPTCPSNCSCVDCLLKKFLR